MKLISPHFDSQNLAPSTLSSLRHGRRLSLAAFALAFLASPQAFAAETAQEEPPADEANSDKATPAETAQADASAQEQEELETFPFNLALVSPLELMPGAGKKRILLELGALYGNVGASAGARFDGLASTVRQDSFGFGASGLWTSIGGNLGGFDAAGLGSWVGGDATGFEAAGAFQGTAGKVTGLQAAGLVTFNGESKGVTTAGLANWTEGHVGGLQIAGVVNRAGDVNGAQIGVVNIGGNVNGAQVGVVNVAKQVDGAQVGIVNVSENARYQATAWVDERLTINAGLRSMWKPMYGFVAVGVDPQGFDSDNLAREEYSVSYGIGGRIPLPVDILFIEADLMHTVEFSLEERRESGNLLRQRLSLGVQPLPWLAVVAGGGLKQHWHTELDSGFELGPTFFAGVQLW